MRRIFAKGVKMGKVTTSYTERIEQMIQTVKRNEQLRKEYRVLPVVLMDAMDEGEARGRSEGSRQAKLETARLMKQANCEIPFIEKMTGLSKAEVEAINNS